MKKKILYLASPYGFSTQIKPLLAMFVGKLEKMGYEVWEPFERNNQFAFSDPNWDADDIKRQDAEDVRKCDGVFAIVNGSPPDEGVCIELGMAIALNKPTFLFRDDFRRCADSDKYPLNIMLFAGTPDDAWEDYYYTSLADLDNPDKQLAKWAKC